MHDRRARAPGHPSAPLPRPLGRATARPLASAVAVALATWAAQVQAATIIVTTPGDTDVAATNTCTLRQAVLSMNTSTLSGNCQNSGAAFGSANTIRFAPSINTITLADRPHNAVRIETAGLTIDAGAGRNVTVERPANAVNRFNVFSGTGRSPPPGSGLVRGTLALVGLTLQNGHADNDAAKYSTNGDKYGEAAGGGIDAFGLDLTLDRCVVRNNHGAQGGGVFSYGGVLTVRATTVTGNTAERMGGGVATSGARIVVVDSTIAGNTGPSAGGGIGTLVGHIEMVNSTISGNQAEQGAAIWLGRPETPVSLTSSTIACNAGASAIKVQQTGDAVLNANSTLFANTANLRCASASPVEIVGGDGPIVVRGERNLVVSSSAIHPSGTFATAPVLGEPRLGPLQSNGGPTHTHALAANSPAINAGANPGSLAFDQRGPGFTRDVGLRPDIGAFEVPYAGFCGSAHGKSFTTLGAGSPNLCSAVATLQGGAIFGTGPWSWFCEAPAGSGNNEFCGASVLANVGASLTNGAGQSVATAVYGQPLRMTVTVSGGASAPTGSVTFLDVTGGGAGVLCPATTLVAGSAACMIPPHALPAGTRLIRAVYNGNGTYGTASSPTGALGIMAAATTTSITPTAQGMIGIPMTVGADVVANAPSVASPRGRVLMEDTVDGHTCSFALALDARTCTLTPTTAGPRMIRATFQPEDSTLTSSATTPVQVMRADTTIAITAATTIAFGQPIDVVATVSAGIASPAISGNVLVAVGSQTCLFDLASTDRCTLIPVQHGSFTLIADYLGDATYAPATSSRSLSVVPHTIGGSLAGLAAGASVVLRMQHDNGSASRTLVANGAFRFDDIVRYASPYLVTVVSSPSSPAQACTVAGGSGAMPAQDVDDVVVTCVERLFADGFDP